MRTASALSSRPYPRRIASRPAYAVAFAGCHSFRNWLTLEGIHVGLATNVAGNDDLSAGLGSFNSAAARWRWHLVLSGAFGCFALHAHRISPVRLTKQAGGSMQISCFVLGP